ncbi:MAG TPA: FAD-binding protein [Acidimicrobiales bacterium]|nr:FAD-binding protein [Acidimicrobiales bacterium]
MALSDVGPRPFDEVLHAFAEAVGPEGPVTVVGGRSAWEVGGPVAADAREVRAPAGVVAIEPAEMTVRVRAGTPVEDLAAALAEVGQEVALPARPGGTVGGALAVGWSDLRRLGRGPIRDALLEASVVGADGRLVRAGGPTVKNVTGYDLCRLLVGSLGTLACIGEAVLRTRPLPAAAAWLSGPADPALVRATVHRPAAILWDGRTVWVRLEGDPGDVAADTRSLAAHGLEPADGPPRLPPHRWSVDPATLGALTGTFVAEVGVGTVHHTDPPPVSAIAAGVRTLNLRMRQSFDPLGRLNPGRDPLAR